MCPICPFPAQQKLVFLSDKFAFADWNVDWNADWQQETELSRKYWFHDQRRTVP